jgi:hypothetical protein
MELLEPLDDSEPDPVPPLPLECGRLDDPLVETLGEPLDELPGELLELPELPELPELL